MHEGGGEANRREKVVDLGSLISTKVAHPSPFPELTEKWKKISFWGSPSTRHTILGEGNEVLKKEEPFWGGFL